MKQLLLSNWSLVRVLRVALGIAIVVQAIMMKDVLFGVMGTLLTIMPLFNIGCCTTGTCIAPPGKNKQDTKEIIYEEVG